MRCIAAAFLARLVVFFCSPALAVIIPCNNGLPHAVCLQIDFEYTLTGGEATVELNRSELEQSSIGFANENLPTLPGWLTNEFDLWPYKYLNGRISIQSVQFGPINRSMTGHHLHPRLRTSPSLNVTITGTYYKDREEWDPWPLPGHYNPDGQEDVARLVFHGVLTGTTLPAGAAIPSQDFQANLHVSTVDVTLLMSVPSGASFTRELNKEWLFEQQILSASEVQQNPKLGWFTTRYQGVALTNDLVEIVLEMALANRSH